MNILSLTLVMKARSTKHIISLAEATDGQHKDGYLKPPVIMGDTEKLLNILRIYIGNDQLKTILQNKTHYVGKG